MKSMKQLNQQLLKSYPTDLKPYYLTTKYFLKILSKIYPNGTIINEDGSRDEADIYLGALDPR